MTIPIEDFSVNLNFELTYFSLARAFLVPVGGFWVPTNKTELLAPWIGLASLITAAATSVVYKRRNKSARANSPLFLFIHTVGFCFR